MSSVKNMHSSASLETISLWRSRQWIISHLVRNVTNILVNYYQAKMSLAVFFFDLNPESSDKDIFSITSLLHT